SNYLDRYKVYVAHLREWRQQFEKLESVDLRYERQIVVNPDLRGTARQPALSAATAKAALAAGVKPAALATKVPVAHTSVPPILAQRTRKNWASSSLPVSTYKTHGDTAVASLTAGTKPGVGASPVSPTKKPSTKVPRWHKRWTPKKHGTATT